MLKNLHTKMRIDFLISAETQNITHSRLELTIFNNMFFS